MTNKQSELLKLQTRCQLLSEQYRGLGATIDGLREKIEALEREIMDKSFKANDTYVATKEAVKLVADNWVSLSAIQRTINNVQALHKKLCAEEKKEQDKEDDKEYARVTYRIGPFVPRIAESLSQLHKKKEECDAQKEEKEKEKEECQHYFALTHCVNCGKNAEIGDTVRVPMIDRYLKKEEECEHTYKVVYGLGWLCLKCCKRRPDEE